MAKFYFTNLAVSDLAEIWDYTYDEWSENQANKYKIIAPELLGYKANHHIIFFRIISTKEIEIIRILHERMDLKSKL